MKLCSFVFLFSMLFMKASGQKHIHVQLARKRFALSDRFRGDTISQIEQTPEELMESFKKFRHFGHPLREKKIDFDSTYFISDIEFSSSSFQYEASFAHAQFKRDVDFGYAKFDNGVNFFCTSFERKADFSNAKGSAFMGFYKTKFYDTVDFNSIDFGVIGSFDNSIFRRDVIFESSVFDAVFFDSTIFESNVFFNRSICNEARFKSSRFAKKVDFTQATINNELDFSNAKFGQSVYFGMLKLNDTALLSFTNTSLPDTIDFSYNQNLHREVDLSVANFTDTSRYNSSVDGYKNGRWHYICLYRSDISKFHLDYSHFRLLLLNTQTGLPVVSDEAKSMYEALLKNFKDRGQMDSYELLDIEYQKYRWSKRNLWIRWWGGVSMFWNNFGYAKERVFLWAAILIVLFTAITFGLFDTLFVKVYPIENIPSQPDWASIQNSNTKKLHVRNRLWYSFIYTSAIFFLFWLRVDKLQYEKWWALVYLITVYLSGIICLAYMASFVLQK